MTHQEASWHAHVASIRANPEPVEPLAPAMSLAAAAKGARTVCGIAFAPLTAGGLLAIQSVHRLALEAGTPMTESDQAAILVYCIAQSQAAFDLVEAGKLRELTAKARALLAPLPLDQLRTLTDYCTDALQRATGGGSDAAPKPDAPELTGQAS